MVLGLVQVCDAGLTQFVAEDVSTAPWHEARPLARMGAISYVD
ncbi:hypothetical protein XFF6992_370171 [Xanthomonas citri pv. fuscans]|nr:hypothetical protein XFF6992_370171 [Xanthomonas citri pv. fuscans]SOO33895.1 hypothetical protein XFF6994_3280009 [Xanthomonas citri pv. fuscans]